MSDPIDPRLLPIFPLASVVLFPNVQVPLYIFEPRYRQMTESALQGGRRIGMVAVDPRYSRQMRGNPPVFDIGCEGEIQRAARQDDGTYHLLLAGTRRFRILEEVPMNADRLYRVARIEALPDPRPSASDESLTSRRADVLQLMEQLAPDRVHYFRPERFVGIDDVHFVNAFCQAALLSSLEKQQLLETNGVRTRLDQLIALLRFRIAELSAETAPPSGTVH